MITAEDLEYHFSDSDDYTWAETYYLPISIPTERIFGHVYVCTRPVLGSMSNDIRFHGSVSNTEFELLYCDAQFHLPAPKKFSHIEGPNGLSVKAVKPPRDYRIDYVGFDDTEVHLDMKGIMDPWDIHDPKLNPLAGKTHEERLASTSMGSGYQGHFDMHCHTQGTVKIRGVEFEVDVIDRMNHSWGPRPEKDIPPMNSVWAQFGEELGFRFHMHLDPTQPNGEDQRFAHGYLLDSGEVYAITELNMSTTRLGIVPISIEVELKDERGKEYVLRGIPLCGGPWRAYATAICWIGLIQWELNGKIGHGSLQENHALPVETRLRGRRWKDRIPLLSA
ncbi:MAG: hypothetical protein H6883_04260 [Rhodobiaceae bacterium]|nr:hypothetical protein [Rhodobiaceae bacterium]MCC0055329.1 hypothetical protein [Rhodobiaceae bacterium]